LNGEAHSLVAVDVMCCLLRSIDTPSPQGAVTDECGTMEE